MSYKLVSPVPCTKGLHLARTVTLQEGQQLQEEELQQPGLHDALEQSGLDVDDQGDQVTIAAGEKFPTVLAEFSSVVADTQQYILQPQEEQVQHNTSTIGVKFILHAV